MKWAIVGTSNITEKFLEASKLCEGFEFYASYSRTLEKAKQYMETHGGKKYYDSLETLCADPEVEAVYVASPNYMHCTHTIQLLRAGKHVLCEKALASNYKEAQLMVETAKENGVLLMEAMRNIHNPGFDTVRENIDRLGTIRKFYFQYCQYSSRYDSFKEGAHHNIFDKKCSAGALMDIGIYCVEPMVQLFGIPKKIYAASTMLRGDIDGAGTVLADYGEMVGELSYSKITHSYLPSEIQGEKGALFIDSLATPVEVTFISNKGEKEVLYSQPCSNNMNYEIAKFMKAITVQKKKILKNTTQFPWNP